MLRIDKKMNRQLRIDMEVLLEEYQSTACVRCVPHIFKPSSRKQSQDSHTKNTTNHQKKLESVGPHDGFEPSNSRVEDADHAGAYCDVVEVDARDLGKGEGRNIAEMCGSLVRFELSFQFCFRQIDMRAFCENLKPKCEP
jgi:hypothetical protein